MYWYNKSQNFRARIKFIFLKTGHQIFFNQDIQSVDSAMKVREDKVMVLMQLIKKKMMIKIKIIEFEDDSLFLFTEIYFIYLDKFENKIKK